MVVFLPFLLLFLKSFPADAFSFPWFAFGSTQSPYGQMTTLTLPNTSPNTPSNCARYGFWNPIGDRCIQIFTTHKTFQDAYESCRSISTDLLSIHNGIDNRAYANLIPNGEPVWLGLNCSSNQECDWLDGSGNTKGYDNFGPSNPNTDVGSNVFMTTTGSSSGRWYSVNGQFSTFYYICAYIPQTPTPSTPSTPTPSAQCQDQFGGFCYTFNSARPLNFTDAQTACNLDCGGKLVSIHSSEENKYVRDLASVGFSATYFHLGLFNKNWTDGSNYDYDNFGYYNYQMGRCASMVTQDDVVAKGKWISSNCNQQLAYVCKRNASSTCGSLPSPTLAPKKCSGTQFLTGNGTIYSPNYPYSYLGVDSSPKCIYIITVDSNRRAQIRFPVIELDDQSTIRLYNSTEVSEPFADVQHTYGRPYNYTSPTNVLKVIFTECQGPNCGNPVNFYYWLAEYGAY